MPENNKPIKVFRDGDLEASIFLNEGEKGPFHSVSLSRLYTDREGTVGRTNSFNSSDLLRVSNLSNQAYTYVLDARQRDRAQAREQRPDRSERDTQTRGEFTRGAQGRGNRTRTLSR